MKNWEKALATFIKQYRNKPFFEGALLCGSYCSGNQNEFSDIDVYILIADDQHWRERGNTSINGFLIEYFTNPIYKIREEFRQDLQSGRTTSAGMFAHGKILVDKNGLVQSLKNEALAVLKKPMPKYKTQDLALDFYVAWNSMDELKSLAREKRSLGLVYNHLLENLVTLYSKGKRIPQLPITKIEKIFDDTEYRKRYHIQKLPNKKFMSLFLLALREQKVKNIQMLYDYVIKELGGFDINHFKLRAILKGKTEN